MRVDDIRQRFLDYFGDRGHEIVGSASLVPHDDPTLFFVNAGMVPFKDVFTGDTNRAIPRATSSQRCVRVSGKHNDLENVGRTPRHHTFFEMLGNFSFGDYFKEQAIRHAWAFLTEELGVDAERLWVTVYEEDDEAYALWRAMDVPENRIQRLGAKDNFWSMGETGPCGPCSEIHYDHGPEISDEEGGPATEDPRYVEIWNLVFMQYEQHADGSRTNLPRPSIDTGMGLERIAAVMQGAYSNYDTDAFTPLLERAAQVANIPYGQGDEADVAMRVIADHARAAAFLICDGIMPSNEGRGYVLRRIMRRAIRFGVKLDISEPFFHSITDSVIQTFKGAYPELAERRTFIQEVVQAEEERFRTTLDRGLKFLEKEMNAVGDGGVLGGELAFTLSDTYGFPLDLTELIAEERGITVDQDAYNHALEAQRERGRRAWKGSGEAGLDSVWHQLADQFGTTEFIGYPKQGETGTSGTGNVVALLKATDAGLTTVPGLEAGDSGIVILDQTPFYAESGGQVGDTGTLSTTNGLTLAMVKDTSKRGGLHVHEVVVEQGTLLTDATLTATVDDSLREGTKRNHTATHLLHAALRQVVGEHVTQKGSLVGPSRLRFDFSHHVALTEAELEAVESLVNAEILKNTGLTEQTMSLDKAKASGAMALFGEKYAEDVRVITVPGFSVELCGGTHVGRTGDIGSFFITSESGVAAGVRRIEAQTGLNALSAARGWSKALGSACAGLKTTAENLPSAIQRQLDERRRLEKEVQKLKAELAQAAAGDLKSQARSIGGVNVLATRFDGDLKKQADRLRDQLGSSLIVLAQAKGPKVVLLVAATKDLAGSRVHAGNLIKHLSPLIGGGGGGRPDMAQAGGKNPDGIDAALEAAWAWAEENLG